MPPVFLCKFPTMLEEKELWYSYENSQHTIHNQDYNSPGFFYTHLETIYCR